MDVSKTLLAIAWAYAAASIGFLAPVVLAVRRGQSLADGKWLGVALLVAIIWWATFLLLMFWWFFGGGHMNWTNWEFWKTATIEDVRKLDVGARGALNRTPLHLAAANGSPENIRTLVELGADKDARDRNGNTPLDLAKSWEQVGNIETLEKLGATRGSV